MSNIATADVEEMQQEQQQETSTMPAPVGSGGRRVRGARRHDRYARLVASGREVTRVPAMSDENLASRYVLPGLDDTKTTTDSREMDVGEDDDDEDVPGMDAGLLHRKARGLVEEFLSSADVKELVLCVQELKDAGNGPRSKAVSDLMMMEWMYDDIIDDVNDSGGRRDVQFRDGRKRSRSRQLY